MSEERKQSELGSSEILEVLDMDFGDLNLEDIGGTGEDSGDGSQVDDMDLSLDFNMTFESSDEEQSKFSFDFEGDSEADNGESPTEDDDSVSGYDTIDMGSYFGTEDIEDTDSYSEEFIDDETVKFSRALQLTLERRSNPTDQIEEPRSYNIFSNGSNHIADMSKYIQIMKGTLDCIRIYNETVNRKALPASMQDLVDDFEVLRYNDPKRRVWNEIERNIMLAIGDDSDKRNRFSENLTEVINKYTAYCKVYEEADEAARAARERSNRFKKISKKEFEFYYEILNRLASGTKVSLCNSLMFGTKDVITYKFQCGCCRKFSDGATTIESSEDGHLIEEGDNHGFYQVITKGARSLFYPMVCENCGAINCLSSSNRELMDTRMKQPVSITDRDKTDYLTDNTSEKGKSTVGDRRWISMDKWKDLLNQKLVENDSEAFIDDENMTRDEILDSNFYITVNEVEEDSDTLLSNVDMDSYAEAIKTFRQADNTVNCMRGLDNKTDTGVEEALALIVSMGSAPLINNIYSNIASYMVDTEAFVELEKLRNDKQEAYDAYTAMHSVLNAMANGDAIAQYTKDEFERTFNIKMDYAVVAMSESDEYNRYLEACKKYEAYRGLLYRNYQVFAFNKKDRVVGALERVAKAFDFDTALDDFFRNLIRETIVNMTVNNTKAALRYILNNKMSVTSEEVRGLSTIKDKQHLQANKLKTILEYNSRIIKARKDSELSKELQVVKDIINELNSDYTLYNKLREWKALYGYKDETTINYILSSGDATKFYVDNIEEYRGPIADHAGKTVGDLTPDFCNARYFLGIFGDEVLTNPALRVDALKAFRAFLNQSDFKVYDIVYSKLLINIIGLKAYIGMDNLTIARNLKLTNGIALRSYDKNLEALRGAMSNQVINDECANRLLYHFFVSAANDSDNLRLLNYYNLNAEDTIYDYEDVQRQLESIKTELGDDTLNLEKEYPLLF